MPGSSPPLTHDVQLDRIRALVQHLVAHPELRVTDEFVAVVLLVHRQLHAHRSLLPGRWGAAAAAQPQLHPRGLAGGRGARQGHQVVVGGVGVSDEQDGIRKVCRGREGTGLGGRRVIRAFGLEMRNHGAGKSWEQQNVEWGNQGTNKSRNRQIKEPTNHGIHKSWNR